ncbi:MAG: alpha/beta fold hydrolase [Planctomycetes bacterium]|nr:alpha/beta fold hydrolase [Planctomycetota bacterium]
MTDRDTALSRMQEAMGPLPGRDRLVPADPRIEEEKSDGGITRRRITFTTEPGDRGWAWVIFPTAAATGGTKRPAMLCLHQTTDIGKDEPAGLGGLPNLHYALELARRGFVTIAPDYPGYGQSKPPTAYSLGYLSATMKGIWNHMRAVDVVSSLPFVAADRIGCIGHSLGGHNTLFVSAFEPRIKVAVTSCGFSRFTWSVNNWNVTNEAERNRKGNIADWSHDGYMPRIRTHYYCRAENMPFDFPDVLAAIAPRPLFINAPLEDCFRPEGVSECVELARPIYDRAGAGKWIVCENPPGGHDFPLAIREKAYGFVEAVLGR